MATQQQQQQQQQPRFVTPRFYRQYNQKNRPVLPLKPTPSSPHSRSRSSTFSKSSERSTASTNGQLQPPSAHQRSVSMTSPSITSSSTSTSRTSNSTPGKPALTRPALSLILPGNQTLTPPDSRSPSQSHLRSSSYTIGQTQGHLTHTSQPQRTISETLHTRNTTVPSIITTPVSPTDADGDGRSPGDTRTSRSNTSDGPKPAATATASPRPRGPSLSALQTVTRETPLNSHPKSPSESTTATNESPPRETADEPEHAGPAPAAVNTESQDRSETAVKPESSDNPRTTTKQAPPLPSERSRQPAPESDMAPVADLLRARSSQIFSNNYSSSNTTTGESPYQNAIATPAGVRSSMPEPPTQSHVQIRNSRLSFTNLKSNLSLNTLMQSQPSGYQAPAPTAPSHSSASTTSTSTAPSTLPPQPQPPLSTPLSLPPAAQPGLQSPNPDSNPHDASSLLALTHHVLTQTSQGRHLFTQFQHYLPFVEKRWIQSTIGDTEAAARDILLLTESMRIDQETNNGKLGFKTQFRWMLRDSRRARERRERLVLCHASLVAVLVRLEGVRAKVPETGLSAPSFGSSGASVGTVAATPPAPVEISASSPAVQKEFEHEIPIYQSSSPVNAPVPPLPPRPTTPTATATATANTETNSQVYPPPPTTAPPPIPITVTTQNNLNKSEPDSPIWELPVQLQDADKELVVNLAQPPPVPPKVKIEEDATPPATAAAAATTTINFNENATPTSNPTSASIISGADTETATATPRTMSPVSPEGPTKLDNELLDMLEWRWTQGRTV